MYPGWPWTHKPPAIASWVVVLQACTTLLSSAFLLLQEQYSQELLLSGSFWSILCANYLLPWLVNVNSCLFSTGNVPASSQLTLISAASSGKPSLTSRLTRLLIASSHLLQLPSTLLLLVILCCLFFKELLNSTYSQRSNSGHSLQTSYMTKWKNTCK